MQGQVMTLDLKALGRQAFHRAWAWTPLNRKYLLAEHAVKMMMVCIDLAIDPGWVAVGMGRLEARRLTGQFHPVNSLLTHQSLDLPIYR